jgi:hypothetical protein
MLAHCLSITAGQFRSKRANALVKFLNLGFSEDGSRRLMLQSIDKGREQVNIFSLHGTELVWVLW